MAERLDSVQIGVVDTEAHTRSVMGGEQAEEWLREHWPISHPWDEEAEPGNGLPGGPMTPAEQRGLMACLIDVCVANTMLPCPMGNCIACRERDAAWEAMYRLLEPKHQEMVQRFLVHAELLPPGMPERDR